MTVLIITDQPLIGMGIAQVLKDVAIPVRTHTVSTATAALQLMSGDAAIRCAVIDLDMKAGGRMREVAALRAIAPAIPLVAITARCREHEAILAHDLACADYLELSADLDSLGSSLSAVLRGGVVQA